MHRAARLRVWPFFVAVCGNPLYTGVLGVQGLYMRPYLNSVGMVLERP